jgi:hypothetical protein
MLTFIFMTLLLVQSWSIWASISAEQEDRLARKLGVACSNMVAGMRQQQTSAAAFTQIWPGTHPECWPRRLGNSRHEPNP